MKHQIDFEEDRRFKQCNREVIYTFIFFIINIIIVMGVSYIMGYNKPADEIAIVGGFPAWYFYSAIVSTIFLVIMSFIMVKFFFKEMSLEPYEEEEEEEEEGDIK